jgi:hypothetical protein
MYECEANAVKWTLPIPCVRQHLFFQYHHATVIVVAPAQPSGIEADQVNRKFDSRPCSDREGMPVTQRHRW